MKTTTTNASEQTKEFGFRLAKSLQNKTVITLQGELGAGKTTFMQGFAKGLGIKKHILSPTFLIMRSYQVTEHPTITMLYHVDLYRISTEQEIIDLGLMELMQDASSIVAIEWPEKLGTLLPKKRINILFEYESEDKRKITLT